jgi:hypothetical protein
MSEWISVENAIPSDKELCWIDTHKWGVLLATFFLTDSFKRTKMFITSGGGHISISEVKKYIPIEKPI